MGHALYSPSAASRWLVCAGAPYAEAGLPDTAGPDAEKGTKAHEIVSRMLTGELVNVAVEGSALGEDYPEAILRCVDAIERLRLEGGTVWIEQRVDLLQTAPGLVWGMADVLILSHNGRRLDVIDHKFGAGKWVDVIGNEQLSIYGLAALETLRECANVEAVGLHVLQPRHHSENWWRDIDVPAAELRTTFRERVRAVVAQGEGAPRTAGDHCQWCRARSHCPALRDRALQVARMTFTPVAEQPAPPRPERMTVEELARALQFKPVLDTWLKAVHEEALQRAHRGEAIPGLKLVAREGNRKWTDEDAARAALAAAGVDPFEPPKLISPAVAERKVGGKPGKALVAPLVFRPVTGAALVSVDDPRPQLPSGTPFDPIDE